MSKDCVKVVVRARPFIDSEVQEACFFHNPKNRQEAILRFPKDAKNHIENVYKCVSLSKTFQKFATKTRKNIFEAKF